MNKPFPPRNSIAPDGIPQEFFDKLPPAVQDLTRLTFPMFDEDCRERAAAAALEGNRKNFCVVMSEQCTIMETRALDALNPKTLN